MIYFVNIWSLGRFTWYLFLCDGSFFPSLLFKDGEAEKGPVVGGGKGLSDP